MRGTKYRKSKTYRKIRGGGDKDATRKTSKSPTLRVLHTSPSPPAPSPPSPPPPSPPAPSPPAPSPIVSLDKQLINKIINRTKNSTVLVRSLLAQGANVNAIDNNSNTALMLAAKEGNFSICKLLLEKGANVKELNNTGDTALMFAVLKGNFKICELLLKHKINVNAANRAGDTALMYSTYNSDHINNVKICKLLLKYNPNVYAKDSDGDTALDIAKKKGNATIVKLLEKPIHNLKRHISI